MTHRTAQIIAAAQAAIGGFPGLSVNPANVIADRVYSLSDDAAELPAICINEGDDVPLDDLGRSNYSFIDSLLALEFDSYALEDDEAACAAALRQQRRDIHKALVADETLGLAFVLTMRYGGANKPEFDAAGARVAGKQTSVWRFHYRMNVADPGD